MIEYVTSNTIRLTFEDREEAISMRAGYLVLGFPVSIVTYDPARSMYVFEVDFR